MIKTLTSLTMYLDGILLLSAVPLKIFFHADLNIMGIKELRNAYIYKSLKEILTLSDAKQLYGDFLRIIKEKSTVCLESNTEYYYSTTIFLIKEFLCLDDLKISDITNLERTLNINDNQIIKNLHSLVKDIITAITEELLDKLKQLLHEETYGLDIAFGTKIKFNERIYNEEMFKVSDSENSENEDKSINFSIKYESKVSDEKQNPNVSDLVDKIEEIQKYKSNIEFLNHEEMLLNILLSTTSPISMQNELLDLFGFEQCELIESILQCKEPLLEYLLEKRNNKYPTKKPVQSAVRLSTPLLASQVTIQSEFEKQMKKQIQKDHKRLLKNKDKTKENINNSEVGSFFQTEIHEKLNILQDASHQPLFHLSNQNEISGTSEEKLPFVWDSLAEAKQTASFISGNKMSLPEGCKRLQNKIYEEIIVPADKRDKSFDDLRIPVESLDWIGRTAFAGTKSLNPIQSIVFPAAYSTNQNLLICAPTGAGKTNVALLTILNLLKRYSDPLDDVSSAKPQDDLISEQGGSNAEENISQAPTAYDGPSVIKRDDFKIVYVAPMKALASEMVSNFSRKLAPFKIQVRELTGDMQLSKREIADTQMIITTPEKWDVITRKNTGDVALTQAVRLLIIDEVHLLQDTRGAVIEAIVARTLRQVETMQSMIRIVGLSATLPSYLHVAKFLRVNPRTGLFFFDGRFRPVPLSQTFIGVKSHKIFDQRQDMDQICFDQVTKQLSQNHQVMVFVHARNATVRTATKLRDTASQTGKLHLFSANPPSTLENDSNIKGGTRGGGGARGQAQYHMNASCRDKRLKELFETGLGFHHAGLLRSDRNLVEKYFAEGHIRVLVCTSTLAWGVNLPAHCVLIKGTEIYDSQAGGFKNLGVLDVAQIFGRAGRPQFDSLGEAILITAHDQLTFYLASLVKRSPVESRFTESLPDALNAEIVLGSVSRLPEAVEWLAYTYLHVRMRANPLAYGISYRQMQVDPDLSLHEMSLIKAAVTELDRARMLRFDSANGYLHSTDIGRVASHYYVSHATVQLFNRHLGDAVTEAHTLALVSASQEFAQIKLREEELEELETLVSRACPLPVILIDGPPAPPVNATSSYSSLRGSGGGGILEAAQSSKVNVLIQAYVSRERLTSFSLTSDTNYINQNVSRIIRALFEMVLHKGWPLAAGRLLNLAKIVDLRVWSFESPLKQFEILSQEILDKLEDKHLSIERLREMEAKEIGHMVHHVRMGGQIKQLASNFPLLLMEATLHPITRSILRIRLTITPDFLWNDKVHGAGNGISWWIWIEDPDNNHIYHTEYFTLNKRAVIRCEPQTLIFTIPIFEPLPGQYYVRAISDHWIGPENVLALSFKHLILPALHPPQTDLLDLNPLPISALNDTRLELLYPYTHFNPIQTQVFHCLYHTDHNALIGAPTGSGKTVTAEIAIFRLWREYPGHKAVYIAPLKALVKERVKDWSERIEGRLGRKIVELTGDSSPDARSILAADLIICTPEKWDGISRSWQTRNYVKLVTLIIIDEIHMLGNDRGPVLEAIVSRTNYIASHTGKSVRVIGLSTALANPNDLANWLGIKDMGLYNFRPSVRPVPLEAHISGFPGKHYCPRMAAMNKPTYQAIRTYSPDKPTIIFVSSRRQTRLTALDLIAYLALEDNPKQWLKMADDEIENIVTTVKDSNLAHFLLFGIGMHHAGLHERDRKIVEELFVNMKIQVLIATSTLAWGVNFPAHLVVIKGTEYYDGKTHKYVDFPITDVLQMMGRAGRPQYDDKGVAVILVQDSKKHFYKKFLYEPFPVESSLLEVLPDHLNAEIVAETIQNKQEALDYLTWTYFFRRLWQNPSFYGLDDIEHLSVNAYLSALVEKTIVELENSYCVVVEEDNRTIAPTTLGRIASFYYLTHGSVKVFKDKLAPYLNLESVINVLSLAREFSELPVRHNEDGLNAELADLVPYKVDPYTYDSPYTKANLLLQCHFGRIKLPSSDYYTDTKSVLDQVLRILQALLDMTAEQGWLATSITIINLMQMCAQARWIHDSSLLTLPHLNSSHVDLFKNIKQRGRVFSINTLPELVLYCMDQRSNLTSLLKDHFSQSKVDEIFTSLIRYPMIKVGLKLICDQPVSNQRKDILINIERQKRPPVESWPSIKAELEYTLSVKLFRLNSSRKRGSKAFCPKFPKEKEESWILILADMEKRELLALKRIGCIFEQTNASITFTAPDKIGPFIYTFYLLSDAYLGLDQQYEICVNVH